MNFDDLEWEPPTEAEMKLMEARRERSDQISKLMSSYLLKGYKMLGSTCSKCETILLQDRQGVNYCVACSELASDSTKDDPVISESAAISMAKELELASAASAVTPPSAISHPSAGATPAMQSKPTAKTVLSTSSNMHHPRVEVKPEAVHEDDAFKEEPAVPFLSMSSIDVQSYTTTAAAYQANPSANSNPSNKVKSVSGGRGDPGALSSTLAKDEHSAHTKVTSNIDHNLTYTSQDSVHVGHLIEKIEWASEELHGTHSIEYSIHLCQLMKIAGEAIVALRNARV